MRQHRGVSWNIKGYAMLWISWWYCWCGSHYSASHLAEWKPWFECKSYAILNLPFISLNAKQVMKCPLVRLRLIVGTNLKILIYIKLEGLLKMAQPTGTSINVTFQSRATSHLTRLDFAEHTLNFKRTSRHVSYSCYCHPELLQLTVHGQHLTLSGGTSYNRPWQHGLVIYLLQQYFHCEERAKSVQFMWKEACGWQEMDVCAHIHAFF